MYHAENSVSSRWNASGRPEFQDRQPLDGRIMRTPWSQDPGHTSVLDAQLFYKERDLLPESVDLGPLPESSNAAARRIGTAVSHGESGEGDRVQDGGADALRPALGQRDGRIGRDSAHGDTPREFQKESPGARA